MPTTVRQWLPARIGLALPCIQTALVGEILAVLLTTPVSCRWSTQLAPVAGGMVLPIAIIAVVRLHARAARSDLAPAQAAQPGQWLPDWHLGLVWRLGGLFCCINAIYFAATRSSRSIWRAKAAPI